MGKKKPSSELPQTPNTPEEFCKELARLQDERWTQLQTAQDALSRAKELETEETMLRMRYKTFLDVTTLARLQSEIDAENKGGA